MLRIIQRIGINRDAKLINKVNELYKKGDNSKAEKVKSKISKDPCKLYWTIQRARELRIRGV